MANVVTGRRGEPHITSDDDRARHIEEFGKSKFVLNIGKRLWATKVSNNAVSIADGMCMSCGTQMGIEPLHTETVVIENGIAGQKRHDLIVMEYTRDRTQDIENAELVVLKGAPQPNNPSDPVYTEGDIMAGAELDQTPLWRVVLDGTTITELQPIYKLRSGMLPTDPTIDPEGTEGQPDPDATAVITAATIDKLWGMAIPDGDAGRY